MIVSVNLPKSGMGIEEGTVSRWLKRVGEKVKQGEPIVEVESAKALQEVQAPVSGTLVNILAEEGQTIPVNSDLALIEQDHV